MPTKTRPSTSACDHTPPRSGATNCGRKARKKSAVNVLNPKTALFFLAFLPQFVAPDRGGVWSQALVLGLVFVGIGLLSDSLYAFVAGTAAAALRRHRRVMRYGSGLVYVGLGAAAGLAKRS